MENVKIRLCNENDIEKLMELGEKTFRETFEHENTREDMDNYCKENFSFEIIEKEIKNANSKYYIAEAGNIAAGYMKINFFGAQTEENFENSLELQRIYVLKSVKGKGIGKKFMEEAIEEAKRRHLEYIWLGVWEHNEKAIRFYENKGFVKFGEHTFWLGDDKQVDYLMKLAIL